MVNRRIALGYTCKCLLPGNLIRIKKINRYGLVGGYVLLGVVFEVSKVHARLRPSLVLFLLPVDQDIECPASSPASGLLIAVMLPTTRMD